MAQINVLCGRGFTWCWCSMLNIGINFCDTISTRRKYITEGAELWELEGVVQGYNGLIWASLLSQLGAKLIDRYIPIWTIVNVKPGISDFFVILQCFLFNFCAFIARHGQYRTKSAAFDVRLHSGIRLLAIEGQRHNRCRSQILRGKTDGKNPL